MGPVPTRNGRLTSVTTACRREAGRASRTSTRCPSPRVWPASTCGWRRALFGRYQAWCMLRKHWIIDDFANTVQRDALAQQRRMGLRPQGHCADIDRQHGWPELREGCGTSAAPDSSGTHSAADLPWLGPGFVVVLPPWATALHPVHGRG